MRPALALLLLACGVDAGGDAGGLGTGARAKEEALPLPVAASDDDLVPLAAPRLLRRMSLDLRGRLPTAAELDQAEADPGSLATLRDSFLDDPDFEARLVRLLGDRWLTRVDEFLLYYYEYPTYAEDAAVEYVFERSVGEEPLRLMAHVAATDEPWPTILTADWTMATETTAAVWPLDYPAGAAGWQVARYTDSRPAAGVLATNGLWWRYYTTLSNMNRGRAAALARLLLCEDYLSRPVSLSNDVALVDEEGVESALRSNPYCMGCHSSLDPIASSLFGFWPANEYNGDENHTYHAERELYGSYMLGLTPELYGRPASGLAELATLVSDDPRFARCTASSMAEVLWRRAPTVEDFDRVEVLRQAYLDGGERLKPLLAAVTDSAVYQAGSVADEASDAVREAETTARLVDGPLLDSVVADLVGLDWTAGGFRLLDSDTTGFRIMAGGVDGEQVTRPQATPGLTWALTVERAGEATASLAVADIGVAGTLLSGIDADSTPADAAWDETVEALSWRLLAERPTGAEMEQLAALWSSVAAVDGASEAWRALVVTLVRDPRFGSY